MWGKHKLYSTRAFQRDRSCTTWLSITSFMYSQCRMSSAEDAARKRKQPDAGTVACINCQETKSSGTWKAVFQEAGGNLAIPQGRRLGDGTYYVRCATPSAGGEWWLCGKCYQRRSVCGFGENQHLQKRQRICEERAPAVTRQGVFNQLKKQEAENQVQEEVRVPTPAAVCWCLPIN